MFSDNSVWKIACEMAASGAYTNVATIERELRRRGLISREITSNVYRREFLTRACHAGRDGVRLEFRPSPLEALHSL